MSVQISTSSATLTVSAPARPNLTVSENTVTLAARESEPLQLAVLQAVATISVFQQGIAGPPGTAETTVLPQLAASSVWTLVHDLNRYPSVQVFDSSNDPVWATYRHLDRNTIQVTFGRPTSGVAYIN